MSTPNLHDLFFEIAEEIRAKKGYASTKKIRPVDFPNEISTIGTTKTPEQATKVPSAKELMIQIAEAIRNKTGESEKILPTNFPEKIRNIITHTHSYWASYYNEETHKYVCSCGANYYGQHYWSQTTGKRASAATCSKYATYYKYCYSCLSYSKTKTWTDVAGGFNENAHGEYYSNNNDTIPSTCTTGGYTKVRCGWCHEVVDQTAETDPLGHAWQYLDDVYENGVHFYYWKCSRCDIEASTTTGQPPSK